MRSLRARLVLALIALAAAGLLALAAITYAEQRSFLMSRVDEQTQAAVGTVTAAGHPGARTQGDHHGDGGLSGQDVSLPLGTYGEQRDARGNITSAGYLGQGVLGGTSLAPPTLPRQIQTGRLATVTSHGASYRVYAAAVPDGGVSVVAVPLREVDAGLHRLLLVEGLVLAGVLVALAAAAWLIVRVGLRPLQRIERTAAQIAAGDLSHRAADSDERTEVGRLGRTFNGMLDRLEEAFRRRQASEDRLRHFLADASHELRTPLASVRGYAEVYRMGAARSAAEVDRAMERIGDEASRMSGLVEDLLTLARLDRVEHAPYVELGLASLVADAVDDARATAPERSITLQTAGPATVRGEESALRQVLANLLRNAIVHTPPAAAIDVSLRPDRDGSRLTVRDHGPGLPTRSEEQLFERFWRAEGGRERGPAGAGLGLAIVDGIVRGHGGHVAAHNAPGGGAMFTVWLPAPGRRMGEVPVPGGDDRRSDRPRPYAPKGLSGFLRPS